MGTTTEQGVNARFEELQNIKKRAQVCDVPIDPLIDCAFTSAT
jgi:hypothetical protein